MGKIVVPDGVRMYDVKTILTSSINHILDVMAPRLRWSAADSLQVEFTKHFTLSDIELLFWHWMGTDLSCNMNVFFGNLQVWHCGDAPTLQWNMGGHRNVGANRANLPFWAHLTTVLNSVGCGPSGNVFKQWPECGFGKLAENLW